MTDTTTHQTITIRDLPPLGEAFYGGTYQGVITLKDGTHVAIVLLADKPDKRLSWSDAKAWAKTLDADLPTRPEAALLFALLRSEFEQAWHWTNETAAWNASYAWLCDFSDGHQNYGHKLYEGCARAVRLIPLSA